MVYGKQTTKRNGTEHNRTEQTGMVADRAVSGKNEKCMTTLQFAVCNAAMFAQRSYLYNNMCTFE